MQAKHLQLSQGTKMVQFAQISRNMQTTKELQLRQMCQASQRRQQAVQRAACAGWQLWACTEPQLQSL